MEPSEVFRDILLAAVQIPEPFSALSEDDKKSARELLPLFEHAESQYGVGPHSEVIRALLLSKNGRFEEALVLAEQRNREAPNWKTAVAVANAARRGGDLNRAAAMFAKGAEHDPQDLTCFLEIGDIRLRQARWADALSAYEAALAKEPSHQQACQPPGWRDEPARRGRARAAASRGGCTKARKVLPGVWPAVSVAAEVGCLLGAGEVLQRPLPHPRGGRLRAGSRGLHEECTHVHFLAGPWRTLDGNSHVRFSRCH